VGLCAAGLSGATSLSGSTGAATTARTLSFPGTIEGMTPPQSSGDAWVVSKLSKTKAEMYQMNMLKDTVLGYEAVSPLTDTVSESANDSTLAIGTTGGKFPAVVWYSGHTGFYANTNPSTTPVPAVLVNAAGSGIYSIRGAPGAYAVSALGLLNGLSYSYPVPGTPVALVLSGASSVLVLDANGTVGALTVPGGTYTTDFSTGAPARSMALSPDGSTLWVLRQPSGGSVSIAEVAVAAGKVVETLSAPRNCTGIALSADGHTLYEVLAGHGKTESALKPVAVP